MRNLSTWRRRDPPGIEYVAGDAVAVRRTSFPDDAAGLYGALCGSDKDHLWRYIPFEPFKSASALSAAMAYAAEELGWRTHCLLDPGSGAPLGMASYMRNRPEHGSTEVGCIVFSRQLQRTRAATEAMYLMARHVFDALEYRRYEWKCDNRNMESRRAAVRFGFSFEGVFRNDMVMKGESRDTAWYSITDAEWPRVKASYEAWLAPENFDAAGRQRRSLSAVRADQA